MGGRPERLLYACEVWDTGKAPEVLPRQELPRGAAVTAETRKMKGRKLERVLGERRMEKRRDGKMHSRVKLAKYPKTVVLNTGP